MYSDPNRKHWDSFKIQGQTLDGVVMDTVGLLSARFYGFVKRPVIINIEARINDVTNNFTSVVMGDMKEHVSKGVDLISKLHSCWVKTGPLLGLTPGGSRSYHMKGIRHCCSYLSFVSNLKENCIPLYCQNLCYTLPAHT